MKEKVFDVFGTIANVAFIRKGITEIVFQFMIIERTKPHS